MRRLFATILFLSGLLLPCTVFAQAHYCDTTQATSGAGFVGVPDTVQACLAPNDTGGTPVTPTNWTLYVDAAAGAAIVMTKVSTSTVSQRSLYTGSYTPSAVGTHTIQITATGNGKESSKSNTYTMTVTQPPGAPLAPTSLTVN